MIGSKTTQVSADIRKRQINAKFKHKDSFQNADGSSIETYDEFKESQMRFLKEKNPNKYVADCILLGEGSQPKDAVAVIDDETQACII